MAQIQVRHLGSKGQLLTGDFLGAPCIDLQISFQKPTLQPAGTFHIAGLISVTGLLDTGADFNLLDETLIPAGCNPLEMVSASGVTGSRQCLNYGVTLYLKEAAAVQETGVLSMDHRPDRPYQMILGRKFLQATRFRYDGHLGITHLEYFDNVHGK